MMINDFEEVDDEYLHNGKDDGLWRWRMSRQRWSIKYIKINGV